MYPKISVITIVYNNVKDIERTIKSVVNQTYPNLEYLIIDGNSTDGTKEVIEKYKSFIQIYVSEPDKGIYDAMNKGLRLATGDYILYMNSGDEIYDSETLSHIFTPNADADIYYGETEMYNENWESLGLRRHKTPANFTWKSFKYGMNISHQAIYVKRSIAPEYNLKYKYSADIDWVIRTAKTAKKIVNTNRLVAKYLVGGISKQKHWESLKERYAIFNKYYGYIPNFINHIVIALKLGIYYLKHKRTND